MFNQIYITMKKLLLCATIAVAMCFASCEGFDASEILDRLDNLENQLDDLKNDEENNQGEDNPDNPGGGDEIPADKTQAITFADPTTKLICILQWDENEDGELSYEEAAAVTDLGTAFKGFSILAFTELKYFTSLEKIADNAFEGCASLIKITLPEQITTIGVWALKGCKNLKKIAIPNAVTEIGVYAFNGCTSLTSVTIGNSVTTIGGCAFSGCTSLTSIIIPDSVTSIGYSAFNGCTSLTSIIIPDSVTSIEKGTFFGCTSLTSVTIGNGVTSIGEEAFYECTSLTSVYCKPTTPPAIYYSTYYTSHSSFSFNEGMKIYVPRDSYDAYMYSAYSPGNVAQSNWCKYKSYIEPYDFE